MSIGSTCSQTRMKIATKSMSIPIDWSPAAPVRIAMNVVASEKMIPEQQPRGHEQLDRILEVEAEPIVAAAALGHQPQRQPHQRAERGLDRADVDGGDREQEEEQRGHDPLRSGRRRRPPFRPRAALPRAPSGRGPPCRGDRSRAGAAGRAGRGRAARCCRNARPRAPAVARRPWRSRCRRSSRSRRCSALVHPPANDKRRSACRCGGTGG